MSAATARCAGRSRPAERSASTTNTAASGGRRARWVTSSRDPGSAQCRSSSTSSHGLAGGQASDELRDGAVHPEPLGRGDLEVDGVAELAEGGEHHGQRPQPVGRQAVQVVLVEGPQVGVEGVDERPEGQGALELGGASGEDQPAVVAGRVGRLGQQARLADARLTGHHHEPRRTSSGLRHGAPQHIELPLPTKDWLAQPMHGATPVVAPQCTGQVQTAS